MKTGVRILLVEDDEYDARLVRAAWGTHAFEETVVAVTDGQQALDYLYRRGLFADRPPFQPSVVLLDLNMPRVDGFEVLKKVKNDPLLRAIPIVVLTSSNQPRDLMRAYELGANGYVLKALDFAAYTEALRTLKRYWLEVNEIPPASGGPRPGLDAEPPSAPGVDRTPG